MKTALITGATSGIGKAIALRLAKEGYNLIVTGRRIDRLHDLKDMIEMAHSVRVHTLCFDIRKYEEVSQAVDELPSDWKSIDVLVNNAGLAAGLAPIHEGAINDWEQMIDTNVKGLLYITHLISKSMVERRSGHIINIGSIAGRTVYPNGVVYCATKFAVNALTEGMRMDFLPYGIRVTQVSPGAVETEFSLVRFKGDQERANDVYKGFQPLLAENIAESVCFAITQPSQVTIQDILVMPTAQASPTFIHKNDN